MREPIITLTTDFGEDSPYVAAMKGVILSVNPLARIVDLSHAIPPQDVLHGAFFLAEAIPYFPADVIHVVVVDPGVGGERKLLFADVDGHRLLAPDNGVWTLLARERRPRQVRHLTASRFWRQTVSATFHGRDILAPTAAHLSLGLEPALLGPAVSRWVELALPTPAKAADWIEGEVVFVDHFGNLITNIPGDLLWPNASFVIMAGGQRIDRWVRAYAEAEPGSSVALLSSSGLVEIAVTNGNAAKVLGLDRGVHVLIQNEPAPTDHSPLTTHYSPG